jgi:hypothetical protein
VAEDRASYDSQAKYDYPLRLYDRETEMDLEGCKKITRAICFAYAFGLIVFNYRFMRLGLVQVVFTSQ